MHIHNADAFKEYQATVYQFFQENDLDKDGYLNKAEHLAFCKALSKYNDEKHGGTDQFPDVVIDETHSNIQEVFGDKSAPGITLKQWTDFWTFVYSN